MPMFTALTRALRDLIHPRVLAVLFLPVIAAVAVWSFVAWAFWTPWLHWFAGWIDASAPGRWLVTHGAGWAITSLGALSWIALIIPAALVTALLITEFIAMPVIVSVAGRTYPGLQKKGRQSLWPSITNAAAAISIFLLLWVVTLPLWLTGIGAFVLPALNSAYLNQRLFRFDAMAEHASAEEYHALVSRNQGRLYVLGLLLALLYYVPLINLLAPVFSGLAFTHFCLSQLAKMRQAEPGFPKAGI